MASILLKNVPKEVIRLILEEQTRIKEVRDTRQYSMESTIYKMIKDYDKCRKANNFKPEE